MRKVPLALAILSGVVIGALLVLDVPISRGKYTFSVSFESASGSSLQMVTCAAFTLPEDKIAEIERGEGTIWWEHKDVSIASPHNGQAMKVKVEYSVRGSLIPV